MSLQKALRKVFGFFFTLLCKIDSSNTANKIDSYLYMAFVHGKNALVELLEYYVYVDIVAINRYT